MRQLASTFDGFFLKIMPSVLATQLKRQLVFLRNSAAAYDDGALEEAVRIAVVIRVLCHDTAKSTSLLAHMGLKESIRLVSTANLQFLNIVLPAIDQITSAGQDGTNG